MTITMMKRLAARTAIFFALTVLAFWLMRPLTVHTGLPDVMKGMTAAAVLAWAEITLMWIRIAMAPKVDEQLAAQEVHELASPVALALLYGVHAFKWAVRLLVFVALYQGAL